jgi:hypothetical protein
VTTLRGTVIVADDIRMELSGKLFVVGLYTDDITLPFEPFIAPQMSVLFTVEAAHPEHPKFLNFSITLPGEKIMEWTQPLNWPQQPELPSDTPEHLIRKRWTVKVPYNLGIVTLRSGPIETRIWYDKNVVIPTRYWIRHTPAVVTPGNVG